MKGRSESSGSLDSPSSSSSGSPPTRSFSFGGGEVVSGVCNSSSSGTTWGMPPSAISLLLRLVLILSGSTRPSPRSPDDRLAIVRLLVLRLPMRLYSWSDARTHSSRIAVLDPGIPPASLIWARSSLSHLRTTNAYPTGVGDDEAGAT